MTEPPHRTLAGIEQVAERFKLILEAELPEAKFVLVIGDEHDKLGTTIVTNDEDEAGIASWLERGARKLRGERAP